MNFPCEAGGAVPTRFIDAGFENKLDEHHHREDSIRRDVH